MSKVNFEKKCLKFKTLYEQIFSCLTFMIFLIRCKRWIKLINNARKTFDSAQQVIWKETFGHGESDKEAGMCEKPGDGGKPRDGDKLEYGVNQEMGGKPR